MTPCESTAVACVCSLSAGHDKPHTCACGGAWVDDEDGQFRPVRFPGGREVSFEGLLAVLDDLFDAMW